MFQTCQHPGRRVQRLMSYDLAEHSGSIKDTLLSLHLLLALRRAGLPCTPRLPGWLLELTPVELRSLLTRDLTHGSGSSPSEQGAPRANRELPERTSLFFFPNIYFISQVDFWRGGGEKIISHALIHSPWS